MSTTATRTNTRIVLRIVSGRHAGAVIELVEGPIMIGMPADSVPFLRDDPQSSPRRAVVARDAETGNVWVEDLGSTNGMYVNGRQVTSRTPLRVGDALQVGETALRLEALVPPPGAAGPDAPGRDPWALLADQALTALKRGALDDCEALFRKLAQSPAHQAQSAYGLGCVQLARSNPVEAREAFLRCLELDPQHGNACYQLGFIAEKANTTAEARDWYYHALAVNPVHRGASAALARLQNYGVYDFLKTDPAPVSRQAVVAIDDLALEAAPSFAAYLGAYPGRILLAIIAQIVLCNVYSLLTIPVFFLLFYLYVRAVRIRVHRGRLQIEHGLLTRRLTNIDIWRIRNIDLHRRLINRMTGDGVLVLDLTPVSTSRPRRYGRRRCVVRVIGIARGPRLLEIHQHLLNLEFLLRSNPAVKGIIQ